MESIGQYLRKERELREISLKEIAHQTKISPFHLRALETDNFSVFPGEAFIRGFLHNYAACIGLDANDIVNRYLDQLHPSAETAPSENAQPKTVKISLTEKANPKSEPKISFVAKIAFSVSALIAVYFLLFYTIALWNHP